MHQYTGDPTAFHTSVPLIEDTDDPTAENLTAAAKYGADNDAYLLALASLNFWERSTQAWTAALPEASPVKGYPGEYPVTGLRHPPIWDARFGRWLISAAVSGTPNTYDGYCLASYNGLDWSQLFFQLEYPDEIVGQPQGLIVRPTDGAILAVGGGAGAAQSGVILGTLPGFTGATLGDAGAGNWYAGAWFSNQWVVWQGGSTNAPWYAPGTVMTVAATWGAPIGFTIHNQAHAVASSLILLFPAGTSVVSSYMSSTDGENWSVQTMPTLDPGESVADACYDAVDELFYLLTSTSSAARVWQSSTGATGTWTVVSTLGEQAYAMRANGPQLLVWIASYEAPSTSVYRAIRSLNAGTTWSFTQLVSSNAPGDYFSLHANGAQFLYCNTNEFNASLVVGANLPIAT